MRFYLLESEEEAKRRSFRPLEQELLLLSVSPSLSLGLSWLLRSLQGDLLAGDGFLLGNLKLGEVPSLCLVGECSVRWDVEKSLIEGEDDLLLLSDLELQELSDRATAVRAVLVSDCS